MSKIYVTSDHHFFHNNIIKYCERPYDWHKPMNEDMIQKWNEVVKPDDIVIHLGDISAALHGRNKKEKLKNIIDQLNGKKYLIIGNHDHLSIQDYKDIGFLFVSDYLIKEFKSKRILFSHYPTITDEYSKLPQQNAKKFAIEENAEFVIHGHRHKQNPTGDEWDNHFNVCVDNHGFYPVELNTILDIFDI